MCKKSVRPDEVTMNYLKTIFVFTAMFAFHAANAESLKEIISQKGRDYVTSNPAEIAKKISDDEKLILAQLLIRDIKGADVPKVLTPLAKNGNIGALGLLAQKYNVGINGIPLDRTQAQIWTTKLEEIFNSSRSDKDLTLRPLCNIYSNKDGALYNADKNFRYCKLYYESGKVDAAYAFHMLNPDSIFYNPAKGLALYKTCIGQNNIFCKWNYGWQGRTSVDIARISSATELFGYASSESDKNNGTAMNNLGVFYEEGLGINQDIQKAIELYEKSINSGVEYSFYNLLRIAFFRPGSWKDGPKNVTEASTFLAFYDYFSEENDRADSVPFKQWLFEKNRLPSDSEEFKAYLNDKAIRGDAAAACMMADETRRGGNYLKANEYVLIGKKSTDNKIKEWCTKAERKIQALQILKN